MSVIKINVDAKTKNKYLQLDESEKDEIIQMIKEHIDFCERLEE